MQDLSPEVGGNRRQSETCPPHPGFLRGLCIRCGELQKHPLDQNNPDSSKRSVSLRYLHSDLEINKEYVRELKEREASRLIAQKKLSFPAWTAAG